MKTLGFKTLGMVFVMAFLVGCEQESNVEDAEAFHTDDEMVNPDENTDSCSVFESGEWNAWIEETPGAEDNLRLHVEGEVVVPTPGYTFSWELSLMDRAMPPGQHLILKAKPPEGIVAQVMTREKVTYEGKALYSQYRVIFVRCGENVLAEIYDVQLGG